MSRKGWSRFSIANLLFLALGFGLGLMCDKYVDSYSSFRSNSPKRLFVSGAVRSPGEFEFAGSMSVKQALALAGGLDVQADAGRVTLTRTTGGGTPVVTVLDVNQSSAANLPMRPGDLLQVPVSNIAIELQLQKLFEDEDKQNPLSDDQASQRMKSLGFELPRRAVTKVRKRIGVPSSRQRRDWTR